MTEPDNIPERVSRLEESVAKARDDAAAARVLARGADRDVSEMRTELKAHTKTLNALRETQLEQGKHMRENFADVRKEMRDGFAKVGLGMAQITALLNVAIGRPERSDES